MGFNRLTIVAGLAIEAWLLVAVLVAGAQFAASLALA